MVKDDHVYVDAETFGKRLGYQFERNEDVVSIYGHGDFFENGAPYLAVHFRVGESGVVYNPLFGVELEYDTPTSCIENDRGVWVSLPHTIFLLGASCNVFDDEGFAVAEDIITIQMPRNNVLSVAAMIANKEDLLSFDWTDDFGYTEEATKTANTAARLVTLFNGLLKFDGASWYSFSNWSAFEMKFGNMVVQMLCTNSSEELKKSVDEAELYLDAFSPGGVVGESLRETKVQIDGDWEKWNEACKDYLKKLDAGSGTPAEYNYLYQQFEKSTDNLLLFSGTGEDLIALQDELSGASNILEIFSWIGTATCYLSEFQKRDEFLLTAFKDYLLTRTDTGEMSHPMVTSMMGHIVSMSLGDLAYSVSRFIKEKGLKEIVELGGIDAYLGIPANLLLFAWDIASETVYEESLKAVEKREISNYAQKLQNDALENVKYKFTAMKADPDMMGTEDCYLLAEYCYVYLKACYLAREAAIQSLGGTSDEFQEEIKSRLDSEKELNQRIAYYLAVLSGVDKGNECCCLGFLPQDNEKFWSNNPDEAILRVVKKSNEGATKQLTQIIEYDQYGDQTAYHNFEYDDEGRLVRVETDSLGYVDYYTYTYDSEGRLTEYGAPGEMMSSAKYIYNDAGQLVETDGAAGRTLYEYDDAGKLFQAKTVSSFNTQVTEYVYEGELLIKTLCDHYTVGSMSENTALDGIYAYTSTEIYKYDEQGILLSKELHSTSAGTISYDYSFPCIVLSNLDSESAPQWTEIFVPIQGGWSAYIPGEWSAYSMDLGSFSDVEYITDEEGYLTRIERFETGENDDNEKIYLEFCYDGEAPKGVEVDAPMKEEQPELLSEEEAYAIACDYWGCPTEFDFDSLGYLAKFVMPDSSDTVLLADTGEFYYQFILKRKDSWLGETTDCDKIHVNAVTGECTYYD